MIKTKLQLKVKALCLMLGIFVTFTCAPYAHAQGIDAEEFNVSLVKTSTSGRVLLLQDPSENIPHPGKILLLKTGSDEVVAVRVLKNYSGKFAAKIVLDFSKPTVGTEYRALKKIGDKMLKMIQEREARLDNPDRQKTDEELSEEVKPDDAELDRGITPPAAKPALLEKKVEKPVEEPEEKTPDESEVKETESKSQTKKVTQPKSVEPLFTPEGDELDDSSSPIESIDGDEDFYSPTIQPFQPIDPFNNAVSFQYGSILSYDATDSVAHYGGFGLRYSYTFSKYLALQRRNVQDSLAFEASMFYYSISGYVSVGDSISVVPLEATLKYSLVFDSSFSLFLYGGIIRNTILSSNFPAGTTSASISSATSHLSKTIGALGLGATMHLGPSWDIRFDYGIDMTAFGVSLKF